MDITEELTDIKIIIGYYEIYIKWISLEESIIFQIDMRLKKQV